MVNVVTTTTEATLWDKTAIAKVLNKTPRLARKDAVLTHSVFTALNSENSKRS